jgi:hypothetical protein
MLKEGETYTARLKAGICDFSGNCTVRDLVWKFTVSKEPEEATGDTTIPMGFNVAHSESAKSQLPDGR